MCIYMYLSVSDAWTFGRFYPSAGGLQKGTTKRCANIAEYGRQTSECRKA